MTIEEQLRSLGDHLDEVQESITAAEALRRVAVDASDARSPSGRRLVLLAAAAVVLVVAGVLSLVALAPYDEDPLQPVDPVIPAPATTTPASSTTSTSTSPTTNPVEVPSPTTVAAQPDTDWSGGLLDDLDTDSLRSLASYTAGDVIIPTAPSGWRVQESRLTSPDDAVGPDFVEWSVDVIEAQPDGPFFYVLYLSLSREPRCLTTLGCQPSGESVTIDGVVWESVVVERIPEDDPDFFDETTLRAQVGDRWIWVGSGAPQALNGRPLLENPPIIEFLEGLRTGSPDVVRAIGEACRGCGEPGAEGDPWAASSPTTPPAEPDGTPSTASDSSESGAGDAAASGRPLADLATGDVLAPTYVPDGWTVQLPAELREAATGSTEFFLSLDSGDPSTHVSVRSFEASNEQAPFQPPVLNDPNHPPVEIAGLTWGWTDFEFARVVVVGPFHVTVWLSGLDAAEARRFVEGLRAVSVDEFPGQIMVDGDDGISLVNDPAVAEVVASDERFELTAVGVGDQVCTKLEEVTVPATMGFAANCWDVERLANSGVVDLFPVDATDTEHLIVAVIDSPTATAVRLTSPDGESVVVPTGPVNDAIDGRFFLARLELEMGNGIRLDRFTIEDASP